MTQKESGISTAVDLSEIQIVQTAIANEIGLVGNAYFKYDPNTTYSVKDKDLTAPPSSPSIGDKYIVGASATEDWSGKDNQIAEYTSNGTWTFTVPQDGDTAFVIDEQEKYSYDAGTLTWSANGEPHSFVWTPNKAGKIWTITASNLVTEINRYIDLSVTDFVDNDVTNSKASYEKKNSLVRALELIFAGNPNAVVRCLVVQDDTTDAETSITNLSIYLDKLLSNDSIGYINVAGKIPLKSAQTHVAKASSDEYMAERLYVAGYDLANILDNTYSYSSPNFTDGATYDEEGRTIVFAGNTLFKFNLLGETSYKVIGGNWIAHYLTGLLSSLNPHETITRKVFGLGKTVDFNGNEYILDKSIRDSLANDLINYVRRQHGVNFFEIGRTYSSETSPYLRITTRRIIDEVIRNSRLVLSGYFSEIIDNNMLSAARSNLISMLSDMATRKIIGNDFDVKVYTTPEARLNGIIYANLTVRPSTYVSYIYLTIKPVS